jgi:hypothetical protein
MARAYELAASDLEAALEEGAKEALTLTEAADESGYSADHLGRLVRDGKIPNAGRPGAPRIARRSLPAKAGVPSVATEGMGPQNDRTQIVRSAITGES